ncbi:MAG: putative branched-subunit amino acid permease [Halocynthiibacter sp.]|jgi:predicted branched-subunit amino acid permease
MPDTAKKSSYLRGFRDGMPFILVVIPFSLLFGVTGSEAGLSIAQVMGFSVLVIAGASQFAAVQLMVEEAPTIIILGTALAVNLRMAMYSAALSPHFRGLPLWKRALSAYLLVDQSYAMAAVEFEKRPDQSAAAKFMYFIGVVSPIFVLWYGASYVGAYAGALIPPEYALDFAVPITFLAMVAPMLKTLAHVASAITSIVLTLAFTAMPFGTGLLLAAVIALLVGAQVEILMARRAKRGTP